MVFQPFQSEVAATTQFRQRAAVETWDTWFRWRDNGELRDRTIDDTWQRVMQAIATTGSEADAAFARDCIEAFSNWQLLPDARLLATAGTGTRLRFDSAPVAVLNAGAFVTTRQAERTLDLARIKTVARLAVRLLDDALQVARSDLRCLAVGVIGLGDALDAVGADYAGEEGRSLARDVVQALASGLVAESARLAAERGAAPGSAAAVQAWKVRDIDASALADAEGCGLRHTRLSMIAPQPRLALLANGASDAIDPSRLPRASLNRAVSGSPGPTGPASFLGAIAPAAREPALRPPPGPTAQLALRAAIQPWIDAPIDYPLLAAAAPQAASPDRRGALPDSALPDSTLPDSATPPVPGWREPASG